jgi:RimJ/RimL family protein N-acetyltransferase
MKHNYSIVYGRILLRSLEENNIEKLRLLRNKERQYFLNATEISKESQLKWFENYCNKDNDVMFAVEKVDQPGVFIGAIALYNIDWINKIAECGRTVIDKVIAPESGIGLETTRAVCLLGFEQMKLIKIVGEVLKSNKRIIKVDIRAGFRIVGEKSNDVYTIEMTRETLNV